MNQEQFNARVTELMLEEMKNPLRWWYLSFADEQAFRGAVLIQAKGPTTALKRCHDLKLSPRGQVYIVDIPEDKLPDEQWTYRVLGIEELEAAFKEPVKSIKQWEEENEE